MRDILAAALFVGLCYLAGTWIRHFNQKHHVTEWVGDVVAPLLPPEKSGQ